MSQIIERVLRFAEDLVAALACVARARQHDRRAEQRGRHVVEVAELPNARDVAGEEVDRERALEREVVEVVVEQDGNLAAGCLGGQDLVAGAGAMDDEPRVGSGAVDDAVVDELARLAQHRRVHALARVQQPRRRGSRPAAGAPPRAGPT